MKNPEQFTSMFGVLNVSHVPIVTLYITVGMLGYIKYGEEALGSVTLNLPNDV